MPEVPDMGKPKLIYFDAPVSRGEECRLALHLACTMRTLRVLEAACAAELGKVSIERSERQMTGFAGNFQNETIGEAQRGAGAEMSQCPGDDICVLER